MTFWRHTKYITNLIIIQQILISSANAETIETSKISQKKSADKEEKNIESSNKSYAKFYPNITSGAETAGPWNVEWQPSPTELLSQIGFMSNNLSLGIGERVELGIVPYQYYPWFSRSPEPIRNDVYQAMIKWNFFRNDALALAVVYSATVNHIYGSFDLPINDAENAGESKSETFSVNLKQYIHVYAFLVNYHFVPKWNIGFNIRGNYIYSDNKDMNSNYGKTNIYQKLTHARADLMQIINVSLRTTYSVSREYQIDFARIEKGFNPVYGFGCGLTWVRPEKTLTSIGVGFHHNIEVKSTDYSFHLSFD